MSAKPQHGTRASRSHWIRRGLRRAALGAGVGLLGVWGVFVVGSHVVALPPALLAPVDETLVLEDREGRELAVVANNRARVSETARLGELGAQLPRITVAIEDRRFWDHGGVELRSVAAAGWRNVSAGRFVSGGSTITQQLVKTVQPRTGWLPWAKFHEAMVAARLGREWPRERILEEYLNRIDYGNRRIGPRAAARAYFGKEPADLTLAEAIYLAGLPQSPTRHNPWRNPEAAAQRYARSVRLLGETGAIRATEVAALVAEPPPVVRRTPINPAPQFVDTLVEMNPRLRGRVRTTLDLPLQREVAVLAREHVRQLRGRGLTQAAVVVLDNADGGIAAWIGAAAGDGPGGEIDGVTLPRSAGSVLKPFLYAEAIERRVLTAASVLPDTSDAIRAEYVDYDPHNFDQRWLGPVRLREALGNSLNVPAVWALSRVGARPFFGRLQEWGFRFPRGLEAYGAGLILGNAEPRLVDVAAAFAAFANGGEVPRWRMLASAPKVSRRLLTPETAAIVGDVLTDDDARRRAFGRGSPLATPVRVPVKTGTSAGFRDAWTVGSTRQHTVAVWAGNFDGSPMDGAASIEAAAPLWRAVVHVLLERDEGVPEPRESAALIARDVCRFSGRIPTAESPGVVREWFLAGTAPTESAATWLRRENDGRVAITLPAEFRGWCAGPHNYLGATVDRAAAGGLVIRSPADGTVYALDAALPRAQQQLALETDAPAGSVVSWTVNGQPVELRGGVALWRMEAGEFEVTARSGDEAVTARFRVRP